VSMTSLIACRECDLLQREIVLPPGGTACCSRCGAVLYRNKPDSLDRTLAFTVGAAVLFILANVFPVVGLEAQGNRTSTTLFGTVRTLHDQGMTSVAVLVFVTAILMPALDIGAMLYMLLPIRLGVVPKGLPAMFRLVHTAVGHGRGVHARNSGVAGEALAHRGRPAGHCTVVVRHADVPCRRRRRILRGP